MTAATDRAARAVRGSRGSALLSAVVLLVLIGVVGIVLLRSTSQGLRGSLASVRAREAHYLAVSGLELARGRLVPGSGEAVAPLAAQVLAEAAGPNGRIDFNPDTLQVVQDESGRAIGVTGFGDDVPVHPFTRLADGGYAAFVTNDAAEGAATTVDANGRIRLVGVGAARAGSLETVEADAQLPAGASIAPRKPGT